MGPLPSQLCPSSQEAQSPVRLLKHTKAIFEARGGLEAAQPSHYTGSAAFWQDKGVETRRGPLKAQGLRLAIAVSRFNERITRSLLQGALDAYVQLGGNLSDLTVVEVPGSFELPLACQALLRRPEIQGGVALGAVIRGETPHFEYVASQATSGIMRVMLESGKPLALGILTTDTPEQAQERAGGKAGNKGAEALWSAVEMVRLLETM